MAYKLETNPSRGGATAAGNGALVEQAVWRPQAGRQAERQTRSRPAELARRTAILEAAPVLSAASDAELRSLARRLRPIQQAAGATVVAQGVRSACLFLVVAGRGRVMGQPNGADQPVSVAELGRGDFFGEASLFSAQPSQFSLQAISDISLLALDRSSFHLVFGPDSDVAVELERLANQRASMFGDLLTRAEHRSAAQGGSLIAIYSPKGGTGRTTVALNLGAQLAAGHPHEVVLLDLSYPFNHAALMSNLVPTGSLARASQAAANEFETQLISAVLQHRSGLHVLPSVLRNEEIELINPKVVSRAIDVLRTAHRYVIVDMGTGLTEAALAVLEQSDDILMVVSPELAAAKAAGDVLAIFDALELPRDLVAILINNRAPKPALIRPALERVLGRTVQFEIAYEGTRPDEAALTDSFHVLAHPRSAMASVTRDVVRLIESRRQRPSVKRPEPLADRGTRALIRMLESRLQPPAAEKEQS